MTPIKPFRILIVEDERIVALSLRGQLHSLGYEVAALASAGEEALAKVEQLRPDLVLMDIRLQGDMDGVEAAGHIRRRFGIPVIYLTAYSNHDVMERAKVTEPYGYILKPYEDRELQIVIEMALYKHQMERRLQERERWFAATLNSIGDGVIATDRDGRVTFMNPVAQRLTGWTQEDAAGRSEDEVFHLINEDTRDRVESPLHRAMREGVSIPLANHTVLISKDRTERLIADCAAPIKDDQGTALGGVLVFRDMTERKKAEEALIRLAVLVESANDAIMGRTVEGLITSWNAGAERLYGYTPGEIIGQNASILMPAERQNELQTIQSRLLRGEGIPAYESVRRRKDGTTVDVLVSFSPIKDREGRILSVAVIAHDISHWKRLEEQYRQAQKMEAVGRLAGGIAHDFNNLLTIINGCSQIVLANLPKHDANRDLLQMVAGAGDRAAALTAQLLAYSRKQLLQLKVLDLNALVEEAGKMLRRLIGEDVELATDLAPALRHVKADPSQIEQVLLNLAVNARDAMPSGGRLTIATRTIDLVSGSPEEDADILPGLYTLLVITDTGTGMAKETLTHLFEPFFTTKGQGKGTGLGLATVYGIVKQSGGHIQVASEPGRGSTFTIYLPSIKEATQPSGPPAGVAALPAGTERVLLVEDEEDVRALARRVLQRSGYLVLDASDGQHALALAAQQQEPIDLLVTDVVMPRMGGRQLAEALGLLYPKMKVLYLSGYTDDGMLRHGVLESETAFLPKPFTTAALVQKVREVLDRC